MSTVCVIVDNQSTMYDLVELLNMPLCTFSEEDKIKISGLIDSLNALEESIEPKLCTGFLQRINDEIDDIVPFLPCSNSKTKVCDKFMHPLKERLEHSSRKRNKNGKK